MDQDDVATLQAITGLPPFQLFVQARCQAELAKRGKFGAPALFPAMHLGYLWIHCAILFLSSRRVNVFGRGGRALYLNVKFAPSKEPGAGRQPRKRTVSVTHRCRTETRCLARRSYRAARRRIVRPQSRLT